MLPAPGVSRRQVGGCGRVSDLGLSKRLVFHLAPYSTCCLTTCCGFSQSTERQQDCRQKMKIPTTPSPGATPAPASQPLGARITSCLTEVCFPFGHSRLNSSPFRTCNIYKMGRDGCICGQEQSVKATGRNPIWDTCD